MMTVRDLIISGQSVSSSPDGKHYEPALPYMKGAWHFRDAWEVFIGRAVAIRQTEKADVPPEGGDR